MIPRPGSRRLLLEIFNHPQAGSKRFSMDRVLSQIVDRVFNRSGVSSYSDRFALGRVTASGGTLVEFGTSFERMDIKLTLNE